MEAYGQFFKIAKSEVGSEVAYDATVFVEDSNSESGYRAEVHQVQAKIISWRTSKANEAVFMPVLAYVSPTSGTVHVIEPYEGNSPMGSFMRLNRVTLSANAIKKLCSVAGLSVA